MRIERFEDIEAWKEARALVRMVYEATNKAPFKNDRGLRDQIQRAVISVMSNIAEGFVSQTNKEFIVFLGYSLRSTAEVQSQLYAALDLHYVDDHTFNLLMGQYGKVARMLQGFIRYLKTSKPSINKPVNHQPTNQQTINQQTSKPSTNKPVNHQPTNKGGLHAI
ncbi:MAG: four helix bundle protein [Chloroflexi bacterium CG15_BIG_FIL_POST_REV_8_21_14_020_46_15]|nr:MAG: four helix bundle protein [Chloroflexi bacterium CG15_BIG_FIL_POST_REV_8_21_14_020_46_15]